MKTLDITQLGKTRAVFILRGPDHAPIHRLTVTIDSAPSRAVAVRQLRLTDNILLGYLDQLEKSASGSITVQLSDDPHDPGEVGFTIRRFQQPVESAIKLTGSAREILQFQLAQIPGDQLLSWGSLDTLTCLDIDYHLTNPPPPERIEAWIREHLAPRPFVWHLSKRGGAHLFYLESPPFTGEQLAAAAAVRWRTIDPIAGIELKKSVSGPGGKRVYQYDQQDTKLALGQWTDSAADADPLAIEAWLAENSMEQGARYPHDRCPIDPAATTSATGDPVVVSEYGIYCHRCAGHGLHLGSRRPGFVPWTVLTGSPGSGEIGMMVRNLTHWGHARVVLEHRYDLPPSIARKAYECALNARHPEDPRISLVFHRDTQNLVRVNDSWMNLESLYTYPQAALNPLISVLPQAVTIGEEGKPRPLPSTVAYLSQGHDLADRGYRGVKVIHGFPCAKQFLPAQPIDPTIVPVYSSLLRQSGTKFLPRYVRASDRKEVQWAEATLEKIFPGADWRVIRLLMAAIVCAQETRLGMQPFVFLSGSSGASKSMSTKLASAILGAKTTAITYQREESRLRQAIKEGAATSALVAADEFLKEARRAAQGRWDIRAALEPFLTLTPDTQSHVLHVGSRIMGTIPAIAITEVICPPQVAEYYQIARRIRFAKLVGFKNWVPTLAAAGLTNDTIPKLRTVSDAIRQACDTIMSDLIDRFFSVPQTWDSIADALGVKTIAESDEFEDFKALARRFFDLVTTIEPPPDRPRTRWPVSKGWVRISRTDAVGDDQEELRGLYESLANGSQGEAWGQSESLQERDWGGLLKTPHPVFFDLNWDRSTSVYCRFRCGPPRNPTKLNREVLE